MPRELPTLHLTDWMPTRDTLHEYAKIIGDIRSQYMPRSKHWWHITIYVTTRGLTTTPFPIAGQTLELTLDLAAHRLHIESSDGWSSALPLAGQSAAGLCHQIGTTLAAAGIDLESDLLARFDSERTLPYDIEAMDRFRQVINWVNSALKTFQNGLREETSPVHIFPHHLDVAMNWFSGNRVPGVDPADEEAADEQLTFGFVTGDESIPDAYFYVTATPAPDKWTELVPPTSAYWYSDGWTGAVLPYADVVSASQPMEILLDYFRSVQAHGASLMKRS